MATVACVQFTPTRGDLEGNLERIGRLLTSVRADVVVLPELALSGYFFLSPDQARPAALRADEAAARLRPLAERTGSLLVAGFAEQDGEQLYNSALAVHGHGLARVYRKTHLFYREPQCFAEGDTGFFVLNHPSLDLRVGLMICYDWRFPESARTLALQGADLIACPSNLVTRLWPVGMRARALENVVYVAVANRGGEETNGGERVAFTGHSAVFGPEGAEVAEVARTEDGVAYAELDLARVRDKSFNPFNDVFADRRTAYYQL